MLYQYCSAKDKQDDLDNREVYLMSVMNKLTERLIWVVSLLSAVNMLYGK